MKKITLFLLFVLQLMKCADKPKNNAWDSKKYQEDPRLQEFLRRYVLSNITFKDNDTVIDIGCGNGKITSAIAKKIPQGSIVGIDNDTAIINEAKRNYVNISNISFAPISATTFKTNTQVEKAIAICSLSWMPNQQETYNCISSALVSGGKFFALVSNARDPLFVSHCTVMKKTQWKDYFKDYTLSFYPSTAEDIQQKLRGWHS